MSKIIMNNDEFNYLLNDMFEAEFKGDGDYVIEFAAKYSFEDEFINYKEVCTYYYGDGEEGVCWFNDWYEGQDEIIFMNAYSIEHLIQMYKDVTSAIDQWEKSKIEGD